MTATMTGLSILANRRGLLAAFQAAAPFVPSRTPKDVLFSTKLTVDPGGAGATLTATDLEIAIVCRVFGIKAEGTGSVLLPTAKIQQILNASDNEELHIEEVESGLRVSSLRSRWDLPTIEANLYPEPTAVPEGLPSATMDGEAFALLVRRTVYACDENSTRYALGGCLVEMADDGLALVATDGRRLARAEAAAELDGELAEGVAVLPKRALVLMAKNAGDGPVTLSVGQNAAWLVTDTATIYTRLVEGRFPRYGDIIPTTKNATIEVGTGELRRAVEEAAITTSDETNAVNLAFGRAKLSLSAIAAGKGRSDVVMAIPYDGDEIRTAIDHRFLLDMLKSVGDDLIIAVDLIDDKKPVVGRTEGLCVVLMPTTIER